MIVGNDEVATRAACSDPLGARGDGQAPRQRRDRHRRGDGRLSQRLHRCGARNPSGSRSAAPTTRRSRHNGMTTAVDARDRNLRPAPSRSSSSSTFATSSRSTSGRTSGTRRISGSRSGTTSSRSSSTRRTANGQHYSHFLGAIVLEQETQAARRDPGLHGHRRPAAADDASDHPRRGSATSRPSSVPTSEAEIIRDLVRNNEKKASGRELLQGVADEREPEGVPGGDGRRWTAPRTVRTIPTTASTRRTRSSIAAIKEWAREVDGRRARRAARAPADHALRSAQGRLDHARGGRQRAGHLRDAQRARHAAARARSRQERGLPRGRRAGARHR